MGKMKEEQKRMNDVLKENRIDEAFLVMTESNWWDNDTITNNTERAKFLYETYFDYYHLLFTEGVKGIDKEEAQTLIHQLKLQLDEELDKVKRGIFTNVA